MSNMRQIGKPYSIPNDLAGALAGLSSEDYEALKETAKMKKLVDEHDDKIKKLSVDVTQDEYDELERSGALDNDTYYYIVEE